ncbi:MAG TPA: prephenate dehydratase domain-containing protein [Polyangiaceae bacterium]|jgi:chorismate mutase/prephenate dehydratase|nr:prephenate dehydratase domain-containing protein [Polyangiaceae bacterium]
MSPPARLTEIRGLMGQLDRKLAEVLQERAKLSREIRALVEPSGQPPEADRDAMKAVDEQPEGELSKEALRAIFAQVIATSRAIERPARVAYLGPEGSFCHQMAKAHFGASAVLHDSVTVADALEEVRRQRAQFCVFPFDSSVDGLILPAVSALAETDLVLIGERTLPAMLCLMTQSGSGREITRVYSTSAGHASSERFRKREYPHGSVIDVRSPVEAARCAFDDPEGAAVVPEMCGREYGLEVAKENVGDEPELRCRYGIIGSRPASRSGNDTTCVLFSLDDTPGTLFQVLGHFAERGINLKKIQSRPVRGDSWDYIFYVEVAGHVTDRGVVTAMEAVKGSTKYLKLLGSFPTEV